MAVPTKRRHHVPKWKRLCLSKGHGRLWVVNKSVQFSGASSMKIIMNQSVLPAKPKKTSCTKGHKTSNIFDIFELKKIPALQNLMRAPSSGRLVTSFFFFNHWTHCFSVLFRASFGPKNEHEKLTDMLASFLKGMTLLSMVTFYSLLAEKVLPLMKALLSGHRSRILIKKKQWDR